MGALRTSEQGESAAGEGDKDPAKDDRPVDSGAKIIIGPGTLDAPATPPRAVAPKAPVPQRASQSMPLTASRRGGLGLVILLYVLSAAALGFAIYERFIAT
ncbi:MAG TPA: hypothetical protein VFV99_13875 [Kofleriaceae bacterium]|nr:hypothetical protein [Kofleriaceae bacterium]